MKILSSSILLVPQEERDKEREREIVQQYKTT